MLDTFRQGTGTNQPVGSSKSHLQCPSLTTASMLSLRAGGIAKRSGSKSGVAAVILDRHPTHLDHRSALRTTANHQLQSHALPSSPALPGAAATVLRASRCSPYVQVLSPAGDRSLIRCGVIPLCGSIARVNLNVAFRCGCGATSAATAHEPQLPPLPLAIAGAPVPGQRPDRGGTGGGFGSPGYSARVRNRLCGSAR